MSAMPRLLPLIAVAVGGVLALKALSGVQALPQMLSPTQAKAAEAAKPPQAKPRPAKPPGPPAPAQTCAPGAADLAKEAGLSPGELQVLQDLGTRRGQLDQRERDLDTKIQLLGAAEMKLDAKLKALAALKAEMQGLLSQGDQHTQAEVDRLVQVYSKMKPSAAGPVMATLDDRVRVPIAAALKPAILADILKNMSPEQAKVLTEALAHRFAPQQAALQAASAKLKPAAPIDPLAAPPDPQTADQGEATAKPQPAPKPKPRPARLRRPRPVRKPVPAADKSAAPATPAQTAAAKTPAAADPAAKSARASAQPKPAASSAAPAKAS